MKDLLQGQFEFQIVEIKKLNGYDNANYLIRTSDTKYIFKTYHYTNDSMSLVEAENNTLLSLQNNHQNKLPKPIPFKDGSYVKILKLNGEETICRLLSYLEGEFLGDVTLTPNLLNSLGRFLASLNLNLQTWKSVV